MAVGEFRNFWREACEDSTTRALAARSPFFIPLGTISHYMNTWIIYLCFVFNSHLSCIPRVNRSSHVRTYSDALILADTKHDTQYMSLKRKRTYVTGGPRYKKRKYTGSAITIAKKALRSVEKLKRGIEWKLTDDQQTINPSNAGEVQQITFIAQGNTVVTRVGKSVTVKQLNLGFYITKHATPNVTALRILVFIDSQQEIDAKSSVTAVLDTASVLSPLNRFRIKRYKILFDRLYALETNHESFLVRKSIKLDFAMIFNGAASTDLDKNGLFMLAISDEATNKPTVVMYHRTYFTDM